MDDYYRYKIEKLIEVTKIVTIHYFELSKDFDYPAESHDFWEMNYVDKGHIYCLNNGKSTELGQGELLFYKPMTEHRIVTDNKTLSNVCVVSFECNSNAISAVQNTAYKLSAQEKKIFSVLFEEANRTFELEKLNPSLKKLVLKPDPPVGSMQMIQNSLEQLLIRLIRRELSDNGNKNFLSNSYGDAVISQMIDFMKENVTDKLSLDGLSKKTGYGKTFLCTHFKKVTDKTIIRYFTELQIEEAKRILREDIGKTVEMISDDLNFSTPAYFCSVFKKVTGMSPKEYARMIHAFDKQVI